MSKLLWLAVTADEFELSLAIEESAEKLANRIGTSTSTVKYLEKTKSSGRNRGRRIIKIKNFIVNDIERGDERIAKLRDELRNL